MPILWFLLTHPATTTCGLFLASVLLWILYVRSHYHVFEEIGVPGPKPIFLFGNTLEFANKHPMDVFKNWTKQYGRIFGFYEGLHPSFVVSCPKMASQVLVKHFNKFSTRPVINPFKHELQHLSLQNVNGELWKRQRQAVAGGMSTRYIREMYPVMHEVTDKLVELIDTQIQDTEGQTIHMDGIIERFSLDWFAHAAFGYPSNALTNEKDVLLRYMRASHESMSPENAVSGLARLFPILTHVLKPLDGAHKTISRDMTKEIGAFIERVKKDIVEMKTPSSHTLIYHLLTKSVSSCSKTSEQHIENSETSTKNSNDNNSNNSSSTYNKNITSDQKINNGEDHNDFLKLWEKDNCTTGTTEKSINNSQSKDSFHSASTHGKAKSILNQEEVIGEISGLLGGGVGPVSAALTFCLYTLAVHEPERLKVEEELEQVVGSETPVPQSCLHHLAYLDAFINETLRMYPVAPGVSRMCVEACTIDGIRFTPGTVVRVMTSTMNSDPSYFPDPEVFKPDRFLSNNIADPKSTNTVVSAWMPYGLGPRMCVGHRLAQLSLKLSIVRLLQEFTITASSNTEIPLQVALRPFLVAKNGVFIHLAKRKTQS